MPNLYTLKKKNNENESCYRKSPLDDFEKKVFTCLPNNGTGKFTLSEKKINEGFFHSPFFKDWDDIDSDSTDVYYTYKYKTRYSREEESHIKIDEYSLKRKIITQTQRDKEHVKEWEKAKENEKKEKKKKMLRECKNWDAYCKNNPNKIYKKYYQYVAIENKSGDSDFDELLGCNKKDSFYKCIFTETPKKQKITRESENVFPKKKFSKKGFLEQEYSGSSFSEKSFSEKGFSEKGFSEKGFFKYRFSKSNFSNVNPDPTSTHHTVLPYTLDYNEDREIPDEPFRILSAPKLKDDFYYSILDWSSKNIIAVGLESSLYLWNNNTGRSDELFFLSPMRNRVDPTKKMKNRYVTSVKWNKHRNFLAVGLSTGAVDVWETEKRIKIKKYKNHKLRVGALSWKGELLTSGGRDTLIVNCDIRTKQKNITEFKKHKLEVCGLQWSPNGQLLASGSNDKSLYIWEHRTNKPLFHFNKHKATVKALDWSPHYSNLLISGGGSADKNIFFWNTTTGECLDKIHSDSQVCALLWSKNTTEFISAHNSQQNQIVIWRYPNIKKLAVFSEHENRVLHLSLSPDGSTFISASPDETIRFWEVFPRKNDMPFLDIWNNPNYFVL